MNVWGPVDVGRFQSWSTALSRLGGREVLEASNASINLPFKGLQVEVAQEGVPALI